MSRLSRQCVILNIWQPCRPPRSVMGIALLFFIITPDPIRRRTTYIPPISSCASMCILLLLLGNGLLCTFPRQQIQDTKIFVGSAVFYAVRDLPKQTLWVCLFIPLSLQHRCYLLNFWGPCKAISRRWSPLFHTLPGTWRMLVMRSRRPGNGRY
jgi:hypothetical protein